MTIEAELLSLYGQRLALARCYEPSPAAVESAECDSPHDLKAALERVLLSNWARNKQDGVFLMVLARPYPLRKSGEESRILNIEKTSGSIASRWQRYIPWLVEDFGTLVSPPGEGDLERWVKEKNNWTFYSQIIGRHGPMRIWWASCACLNGACGSAYTCGLWEADLQSRFLAAHKCLPAKNRRLEGSSLLG